MRAIVTGAAGFVGLHLARRLLADGAELDLIDDHSRGIRDPDWQRVAEHSNVHLHAGDLRDSATLKDCRGDYDAIFHLAAVVGVARVESAPLAVLRDNVEMLTSVLDHARALARPPRLVFASTSEVYAGTLEHHDLPVPTPEGTPLTLPDLARPRTAYLLSKIYGEALIAHAGLPATIVRPHNVYGPRMGLAHVIPELFERAHRARDGDELSVRAVEHTRAFCFVEDAVEMLVRVATRESCVGQTLNLGSEEEISIGELARKIVARTGRSLRIEALPARPGDPVRRCPDTRRMRELCGYAASTGLDEGLERTFAWYRDHVFATGGMSAR